MNLNRLSFIIENISGSDQETTGVAYERLIAASNEYKEIVYPELQKISYLSGLPVRQAGLLSTNKKLRRMRNGFPASGGHIEQYSDEINKFCTQLNLQFDKYQVDLIAKERKQILSKLRSLKSEILNLYEFVKLSFETNIDETVRKIITKYSNKEIKIIYNSSVSSGLKIVFDKNDFYEVINNLIQNAVEELNFANAVDKLIEINSSNLNGTVNVSVEDNGRGISAELYNKIFDEGFTTKTSGHGFGLSYVKNTVENYGGKISVDKSNLGGACFIIELKTIEPAYQTGRHR